MTTPIDRLFVIWGAPAGKGRHVVGHLARRGGEFRFWYEADLSQPLAVGFRLLPMFPEHREEDHPYVSRYMFAAFGERIPSPARVDTPAALESWGVTNPDDQFEILAKSGGLRATDRLELAEYRAPDDPLVEPLEFRIAGGRFVGDSERATLAPGEPLLLVRELSNAFDACATVVAAKTGRRAGYVPKQYTPMIARLVADGIDIGAVAVRELAIPDELGRWVVRAQRSTR